MADDSKPVRPFGVTLLAWLHLIAGALGVAGALYGLVLSTGASGFTGLPLFFVLRLGLVAFMGFGVGSAMLKGRPWSWYAATLVYLLSVAAGAVALMMVRDTVGIARLSSQTSLPTGVILSIPIGVAAIGAGLYAYLFTAAPRLHFGVSAQSRGIPLGFETAIVIGASLLFVIVAPRVQPTGEVLEGNAEAIQAIGEGRGGTDDQVKFLLEHLDRGTARERVSAAWALGRSGRPDALPALIEAAVGDRDRDVRLNAIVALGELGDEGTSEILTGFLDEDDEGIRSASLRALAHERFRGAERRVAALLDANSPRLRSNAVDAISAIGGAEAVSLLLKAAGDSEADVRSRVAFGLGKLGAARAIPALIALAKDDEWEVRGNAAQALGMIGEPSGRSTVEKLLDDPNSQVRFAAEQALAKLD